jgi:hypothetical protein
MRVCVHFFHREGAENIFHNMSLDLRLPSTISVSNVNN